MLQYLPSPKILIVFTASLVYITLNAQEEQNKREYWLHYLDQVARPVLSNLASDQLKEKMTVELSSTTDNPELRKQVAYLEAFARTLSGISPWLNGEGGSPEEISLRDQYREWTLQATANAVDPNSRDYMLWKGYQPLVDASFFALAIVRCPWIWNHLDEQVRQNVLTSLRMTKSTIPVYSNWILFSGMIEAFFCKYGLPYDRVRIEYGLREFSQHWYVGDGMFSDGNDFALDYYNSYVIQPYLANILEALRGKDDSFNWYLPDLEKINSRYAEIQERMVNVDGSFPVVGRSVVYRGGAFHHLADMALRQKLPVNMSPAQVRGALTAVIESTLTEPGTFNSEGWLNIGLHGHQPGLADFYITTGSLYLCSTIFLPLGLSPDDSFWTDPEVAWTAKKIWMGQDVPADHSLKE